MILQPVICPGQRPESVSMGMEWEQIARFEIESA
jgi:hypothetical protein